MPVGLPHRPGPARPRAPPEPPRHHRRPARRPARRDRTRSAPLRRDAARGRASRSSPAAGPSGGYRLGRGVRLPPLVFTQTEALALVMAALDGHHAGRRPHDPVGHAPRGPCSGRCPTRSRRRPRRCAATASVRARSVRRPGPSPRPRWRSSRSCAERRRAGSATRAPRPARALASRWSHGPWWCGTGAGTWSAARVAADAVRTYRVDRVVSVETRARRACTRRPTSTRSPCSRSTWPCGWDHEADVLVARPVGARSRPAMPRGLGTPGRGGRCHHTAVRHHQQPGLVRRAARGRGSVPSASWAAPSCATPGRPPTLIADRLPLPSRPSAVSSGRVPVMP